MEVKLQMKKRGRNGAGTDVKKPLSSPAVIRTKPTLWQPEDNPLHVFKPSLFFFSIKSTAKCLAWSLAWWAALPGYTLHPSLPDGQMCHQQTAATPAHLCIHPATPPPATCTPPSGHAGTRSTNTRSISPASPTSTGKPPQAGPNKQPLGWMQRLPDTVNHK